MPQYCPAMSTRSFLQVPKYACSAESDPSALRYCAATLEPEADLFTSRLMLPQGREDLQLSQDTAMQLYGLKHLRIVREDKLDTKCLLAWSDDTLVLSFRGTASTRNAISDLQVVLS